MVNITTAVANNNGMGLLTGGQNVLYVTPISSGTDSSNGSQNLVKVINLIPISNCNTTHHHTVTSSGTNTLTTSTTQKPFITTTTNTNSHVTTANPTVIQSSSYSLTKPTILTTVVSKNASSSSPSLVTTMLNKKATLPQLVNLPSGEKKQVIKLTRVEPQRLVNLVGTTTNTSGNTTSMPMNAPKVINLFSRGSTNNQAQLQQQQQQQQHHVDSNQPKIIMSQPVMTNLPQISQSAISPIRVENDRQDQNQVVININSKANSQMDALLNKSPFVVRASNDQLVDSVVIAGGPSSSMAGRTFFDDELPIELHPKQFFESQPQPQSQVVSVTSTNTNAMKNNVLSNQTDVRNNLYIQQNSCMQPLQVQTDLQHFKTNNTIMNSNAKQVNRQPVACSNPSSILKPVGSSHSPSFNPNHISHLLTQEIKPNNNIYSTGVVQRHSNQHHSNTVKRPVNAFILWSQQERRKLTESGVLLSENESNTIGTVSKRLGLKWRLMSKEEKQPYVLEAERLKQAHRIQHPDYKFSRGSSSTSSSSRNKRPKHSTESSLVTSSASSLNAGDDCYSYPQPSPYSIHSSSDQLNSIESGSTVDVDDLDISNFEFDSTGFENLMNAFEFNQPNTSTGGGYNGVGDAGFTDLDNLLLPLTTGYCETMPQSTSKQASIPQEPVVIDSEPINQNNTNTTIKPNMLDNSFIAITPPVENDIIPMEDFLRSKKRRVCRSNKSRHLATHVTSLNLIPHQGEKRLSSRAQLGQSKPGQQMHVIPIGQNPKLREITEALIKQQKTPVQPGQNLICSIDPNTLQILLSHVNEQLSTTTTSREQQQQKWENNLDDLDLSYDWEVNRASLADMWKLRIAAEEPSIVETVKQPEPPCMLNVDVSKPMLCEGFLTPSSLMDEQHQSDVNFSSMSTITDPNMNAPIDFTQHDLTSEAGYLDMWNMVNVMDDTSSSLIYF